MSRSSKLGMGAIAFGKSGVGYTVSAIQNDTVILSHPQEQGFKRVPIKGIVHWEFPHERSDQSLVYVYQQPFQVGDEVKVFVRDFAIDRGKWYPGVILTTPTKSPDPRQNIGCWQVKRQEVETVCRCWYPMYLFSPNNPGKWI